MFRRIYLIVATAALAACSEQLPTDGSGDGGFPTGNDIQIGGVTAGRLTATATPVGRADEESPEEDPENSTAAPAEQLTWLQGALFSGMDITYGKVGDASTQHVAVLKLKKAAEEATPPYQVSDEGLAYYTFCYRNDENGQPTDSPGQWYDNGPHYFQGMYVPKEIQYTSALSEVDGKAPGLTTDQSDLTEGSVTTGNNTLLARYLAMPADCRISATTGRIRLPFEHRLSRVLVFVLIDPLLGKTVTLKGYAKDESGRDDPRTTAIYFDNVNVLAGVLDTYDAAKQHHTLTPQWTTARRATPHFEGEYGSFTAEEEVDPENFILFSQENKDIYIFPTSPEWKDLRIAYNSAYANAYTRYLAEKGWTTESLTEAQKAEAATAADAAAETQTGYRCVRYGRVPCYGLIVRPTYTSADQVMYDEDLGGKTAAEYAAQTNQIDFDLTLSTGLRYQKSFKFDLDANYQTVVYLRISREQVDYNDSGADYWTAFTGTDGYYGVNNELNHTLSLAGSSWQRAYRNGTAPSGSVTDGSPYGEDGEADHLNGEDGQYLSDTKWFERLIQARENYPHHGDYFVLDRDITIDASQLPTDFVFTGHLDGRGHTVTLTNTTSRNYLFDGLDADYTTPQETADDPTTVTWEANVHKEVRNGITYWVPLKGYRAEVMNLTVRNGETYKNEELR